MKNTKYVKIRTWREKQEQINGEVKEINVEEVDTYSYLGIMINKVDNLK